MEDDIDIQEHNLLNEPALRSVFPDLDVLKRELMDFDNGEETSITENQLDSTFEANGGNPPVMCSTQHLDVKPDILGIDIVVNNLSKSEIVESNESAFYRNKIMLGKINEDNTDNEPKKYAPSEVSVFNNEYKTFSEPDITVVIKTNEDRSRSISKRHYEVKCLQAKVLLTDCYLYLLEHKSYCPQCAILFSSATAYIEHCMSTHTETANSTKACAALAARKKLVDPGEKSVECKTCKKTFRTFGNLKVHNLIHTGEKPLKSSRHLTVQNLIHTGEKPFECNACKQTFRLKSQMLSHILSHGGENPYECKICKKEFREENDLISHKLIHTDEKSYLCTTCNKRFRCTSNLCKHKLIHTSVKSFECKTCKKIFRTFCHLKVHNLIHTGEKPFECTTCKKTFRQVNHLNRHKLIHTGSPASSEAFLCTTCKKIFRFKCNLNQHKLIHTSVKSFECTTCKKTFRTFGNLKVHNLIHTGEKPYECTTCKKTFRQVNHLNRHKFTRHNSYW